ncbi:hypothetical protein D7T43_14260 [Stenotrophomonas maltophilia]|nr:hypothetical protein [Stenotrophomonas maltophilia]
MAPRDSTIGVLLQVNSHASNHIPVCHHGTQTQRRLIGVTQLSQLHHVGRDGQHDSEDGAGFAVDCSPALYVASGIAMLETGQSR